MLVVASAFTLLASCANLPAPLDAPCCVALDGRVLTPPPLSVEFATAQEELLAAARARHAAHPDDLDAAIWVGRRLGYLQRYDEAIEVYTQALRRHPDDAFLLRHRGHRWLTTRRIDRAIADLSLAARRCQEVADAIEPDGLPTPGRAPHSTLHFNVHYHLGLAHFVAGDFAAAERAWLDCLAVAGNDEARVAVLHWLWSVRMRRDDPAGAAAVVATLPALPDVVENVAYLQLCRVYAGRLDPATLRPQDGSGGAALAFGLAHHALVTGDPASARRQLRELARSPAWAAFGVLAAEAECARRGW